MHKSSYDWYPEGCVQNSFRGAIGFLFIIVAAIVLAAIVELRSLEKTYDEQIDDITNMMYDDHTNTMYDMEYRYIATDISKTEQIIKDTVKDFGYNVIKYDTFKDSLFLARVSSKNIVVTRFIIKKEE